jgi:hypothetical protein
MCQLREKEEESMSHEASDVDAEALAGQYTGSFEQLIDLSCLARAGGENNRRIGWKLDVRILILRMGKPKLPPGANFVKDELNSVARVIGGDKHIKRTELFIEAINTHGAAIEQRVVHA